MRIPTRADRIFGCLMGGAIGDAVGAAFEGKPPAPHTVESPITLLGVSKKLYVTDDTQLTVATCEAIVDVGVVDPASIAARFVAWFQARRISGIGSSTLKSLTELSAGAHWALAGASGERSAGNGAAMRVAPLAFFLDPMNDYDRRTIHDVCRITHRNEEAYCGALAIVAAVRLAAEGISLQQELLPRVIAILPDSCTRDRLTEIGADQLSLFQASQLFDATGYVADSVPLAIMHAIHAPDSVCDMMKSVVAMGGDTDTIGSLAGQIFGASRGAAALQLDQTIFATIDLAAEVRTAAESLAAIPT